MLDTVTLIPQLLNLVRYIQGVPRIHAQPLEILDLDIRGSGIRAISFGETNL